VRVIKASEFKAKCLSLMDRVATTREPILVTKNGKPVAELHPHRARDRRSPFGLHKDLVKVTGDIVSPIDAKWDAMK